MRMSDFIAANIMKQLESSPQDYIDLQRNSLALEIGCAPSQINYVLGSRFTPEHGYIVESRRGGGGYVRIRRIQFHSERSMVTHIINAIHSELSQVAAVAIIQNMLHESLIDRPTALAMSAAVSDQAFRTVPPIARDTLRSDVLKQMLAAILC